MIVIGSETSEYYRGVWWVLDCLIARLPGNSWVGKFWDLASKWRCVYGGIEDVGAQGVLVDTAAAEMEAREIRDGWVARPVPIKCPRGLSKEDRIAGALEWRFNADKVKLPTGRKGEFSWRELEEEIEGFTGLPGATAHDDGIDALAMGQSLFRGSARPQDTPMDDVKGWKERLLVGGPSTGIQPGLGVDVNDLSPTDMGKLWERHRDEQEEEGEWGGQERRGLWVRSM